MPAQAQFSASCESHDFNELYEARNLKICIEIQKDSKLISVDIWTLKYDNMTSGGPKSDQLMFRH